MNIIGTKIQKNRNKFEQPVEMAGVELGPKQKSGLNEQQRLMIFQSGEVNLDSMRIDGGSDDEDDEIIRGSRDDSTPVENDMSQGVSDIDIDTINRDFTRK